MCYLLANRYRSGVDFFFFFYMASEVLEEGHNPSRDKHFKKELLKEKNW